MKHSLSHMTVSDRLSEHISKARYDDLPQTTRVSAARALLDGIGVKMAASGLSPDIKPFIELARESPGPCKILGTGFSVSAPSCALAIGAMAHALDFEDAFDRAPCHPNAALIAALIAGTQYFGVSSGARVLTALAVGCDLTCRLGLCLEQSMEKGGWYPPPILGAYGATAAVAILAGLNVEQVKTALSLTLCQSVMPGEIKYSAQTTIRAVREAFPAQTALNSVMLARNGALGFEEPFEGQAGFFRLFVDGHFSQSIVLKDLGKAYFTDDLTFKKWPCCRGTHAYVEMALDISKKSTFNWRSIDSIELATGDVQRMLIEPLARKQNPENIIDAKFSLPFTVAMAFVKREVSLNTLVPESLTDKSILQLAGRITRSEALSDEAESITTAFGGTMRIKLKDGQSIINSIEFALGHPNRPLSLDETRDKFVDCVKHAANAVETNKALDIAESILNFSSVGNAAQFFNDL